MDVPHSVQRDGIFDKQIFDFVSYETDFRNCVYHTSVWQPRSDNL